MVRKAKRETLWLEEEKSRPDKHSVPPLEYWGNLTKFRTFCVCGVSGW